MNVCKDFIAILPVFNGVAGYIANGLINLYKNAHAMKIDALTIVEQQQQLVDYFTLLVHDCI